MVTYFSWAEVVPAGAAGERELGAEQTKSEAASAFLLVADLHLNQTLVMFGGSFINF